MLTMENDHQENDERRKLEEITDNEDKIIRKGNERRSKGRKVKRGLQTSFLVKRQESSEQFSFLLHFYLSLICSLSVLIFSYTSR